MCERRPLCHDCDDLADVLMVRRARPHSEVYAYCQSCRPSGDTGRFPDSVAVHWFDAPGPRTTVYGTRGSDAFRGIIIHLLRPDVEEAVCRHGDAEARRFKISRTLGEDYSLCRECLGSLDQVREEMSELAFEDFLAEVFQICRREGGLVAPKEWPLDYPEVTPEATMPPQRGIRR